jgi:hypothetical protein
VIGDRGLDGGSGLAPGSVLGHVLLTHEASETGALFFGGAFQGDQINGGAVDVRSPVAVQVGPAGMDQRGAGATATGAASAASTSSANLPSLTGPSWETPAERLHKLLAC